MAGGALRLAGVAAVPAQAALVAGHLGARKLAYYRALEELDAAVLPVLQVHLHEYRQVVGRGEQASVAAYAARYQQYQALGKFVEGATAGHAEPVAETETPALATA